jgi:hypothetical protein
MLNAFHNARSAVVSLLFAINGVASGHHCNLKCVPAANIAICIHGRLFRRKTQLMALSWCDPTSDLLLWSGSMELHMEFRGVPLASSLLNRSQLAQKIGARDNDYPRPSGVLVPRALAEIYPRHLSPNQDRRDVGRDVVTQTARALRSLGRAVLDLPMPHPSVVLRSLAIENRTRSVIDRLLPLIAKEPTWTVGRYLQIPSFGARCLVDILAACEETDTSTTPPPAELPVGDLSATDHRSFSATVIATATRLVSYWGLATVRSVVERVRLVKAFETNKQMVCRLLVGEPQLRWLDDEMDWFSFAGDASRLARAVAKVFAACERIDLRELRRALNKGRPRAQHVPRGVLERYLSEIADVEIDGRWLRRRARDGAGALTAQEAVLVSLLDGAGGEADVRRLRAGAAARAVPPETVEALLRDSPLFLRTARLRVRLVGR